MKRNLKRIVFIVPYYGQWPPYFSVWLKTVEKNPTIHFLMITDLPIPENLPDNIRVIPWSLEQMKDHVQSKFDFKIYLEKPYKLCDFKPVFGYIFQEYIEEYDFWGNCDIDCIFGDIRKFIDPFLEKYDAIGTYGHMSIYRNREDINTLFKKDGAIYDYKEVFSSAENFAFDESTGIKRIFKKNRIKCLYELDFMADICTAYKNFRLLHGLKNYRKQIFLWEKGRLWQCYYNKHEIKYKEFMYLHFQRKCPKPESIIEESFYIVYNKIIARKESKSDRLMLDYQQLLQLRSVGILEKLIWILKKIWQNVFMEKRQREINNYKRKYQDF